MISWHINTHDFFCLRGRAERAFANDCELQVYLFAGNRQGQPVIGWEIYRGIELLTLLATGSADSFDKAKHACEETWRKL